MIRLEGNLLDPLIMKNGLRQGCCMAPLLFNLYLAVVIDCWQNRVKNNPGVGINLQHKYDGKLFRKYTKNTSERRILECLFADDGALLATSREGAEKAAQKFQDVCKSFSLTVNISSTSQQPGRQQLKTMLRCKLLAGQSRGLITSLTLDPS